MGLFAQRWAQRKAGAVGYPATGWAPPYGWARTTSTGQVITEDKANTVAAWFAGVRVIAQDVSTLPLITYRQQGRDKVRARDHRAYGILHDAFNPEMTSVVARETMQGHLLTWGNAYAERELDSRGRLLALWPLRPDRMTVTIGNDGKRKYEYQVRPGTAAIEMDPKRVFHIPGMGYDGLIGYSILTLARETLAGTVGLREYGGRVLANDARPGVILTHPNTLSPVAKKNIEDSWNDKHGGLSNAGRTAVLEEGITVTTLGLPREDMLFLEQQKWQVTEVARWLRVAPHKIADLERATFCLPGSELVYTEHGPVPIREVHPGDNVWSRGENGLVLAPVQATSLSGYEQVLTLRTTNRTLRVTPSHRVLARVPVRRLAAVGQGNWRDGSWSAIRETQWVEAGSLVKGDVIVSLDSLPDTGTVHAPTRPNVSVGFMEFCGLLVGDGNVSTVDGKFVGVQIARAESALYMDHYRDVMRREFKGRGGRHVRLTEGPRQTRFKSVIAAEELAFLGFAGTARTKRVPGWVFSLTSELRLAFLRGFLDADGSVDKLGRISFSSAGNLLIEDIRHLCMGLGIPVTNVRSYRPASSVLNGRPVVPTGDHHTFTCSDPGANRRIGSHDPRYVERLAAGQPFGRKGRAYPDFGGRDFDESGVGLGRIVSITRDAVAQPVYDLQVAGTASFIASGVVVHNSNIEEQNIDHVSSTLRPWCTRWEQQIDLNLLPEPDIFAEHLMDDALRGRTLERYQAFALATQYKAMVPNEWRGFENWNPVSWGDEPVLTPNNSAEAAPAPEGEAA